MKRLTLALVGLALTTSAAMAQTPDLRIHTSIYDVIGPTNYFTLTLGAAPGHEGFADVICSGGNASETEIIASYFDSDSGALLATNVACQVDSQGVVEVYCDDDVVIDYINIKGAYVTSIEVKNPDAVEILYLEHNSLESLDLTEFVNLTALYLGDNPFDKSPLVIGADKPRLTILDIAMVGALDPAFDITGYPALQSFDAMSTYSLHQLTPAACPGLKKLSIDNTMVESLDVTQNPELIILNISETRIAEIDLSGCPYLQQFYATHTSAMNTDVKLDELDVSCCPYLVYLFVTGNNLTELDVTQNVYLRDIFAAGNHLTSINLDNNPDLLNVFLQNNDMDFRTLPVPQDTWLDYNLQQRPMEVPVANLVNTPLDLSTRVVRDDSPTAISVFYSNENQPGLEFEVNPAAYVYEGGRLTFLQVLPDSVCAAFTNSSFPDIELRTRKFLVKDASTFGQPDRLVTISSSLMSGAQVEMYVGIEGATADAPIDFFVDLGGGNREQFTATTSAIPDRPNVVATKPRYGSMYVYLPEGEKLTAFKMADVKLTNIHLADAHQLEYLSLTGTQLPNIDLQWNRCLRHLELSGNNFEDRLTLAGANGAYIKNFLTDIILPDNGMTAVKLNEPGSWRRMDLSGNSLEEVSFTDADNLEYLDISRNRLQLLKVNYCSNLHTLLCTDNRLDSLILPEEFNVRYMDFSGNNFSLKNMPERHGLADDAYVYAPQSPIVIPTKGPGYNLADQIVAAGGAVTSFAWFDTTGRRLTEGTDYTLRDGVTRFADSTIGSELYCEISHPAYPAFAGDNALRTTAMLSAGMPTHFLGSFVTPDGGDQVRLSIASKLENDALYVDWTGTESLEQYPMTTVYTVYSPTTTAGALVKVWSYEEDDCLTVFSVNGTRMTDVDLSPMTSLINLSLGGAGLSELVMPCSPGLKELMMDGNEFSEFDFSAFPNLMYVSFIDNRFETLDLSSAPGLALAYFSGNGMRSVNLDNPALWSLSLSTNDLTEIDLSRCPEMYQLALDYNRLSEIDLEGLSQLRVVYLDHNCFDFNSLPLPRDQWTVYTYGGQPEIEILPGHEIDLSWFAERDGVKTVYTWFYGYPDIDTSTGEISGEQLIEDDEYTINDGVTTFHCDLDRVCCVLTNELFPKTYLITNAVSVQSSGIAAVTGSATSAVFCVDGLTITATGLDAGNLMTVCNPSGAVVATARADRDGRATAVLPSPGVYIASAGATAAKIMAR